MMDYDANDEFGQKALYISKHNQLRGSNHVYGPGSSETSFYSNLVDLIDVQRAALPVTAFVPGCLVDVIWTPALRAFNGRWTLHCDLLIVMKLTDAQKYKALLDKVPNSSGYVSPKKIKFADLD